MAWSGDSDSHDPTRLRSLAAEAREAALLAGRLAEALIASGASADVTACALELAVRQVRIGELLLALAGVPGERT